jgi:hypothetical protein
MNWGSQQDVQRNWIALQSEDTRVQEEALRFFVAMLKLYDPEARAQSTAARALISTPLLGSPPKWFVEELWACLASETVVGKLAAELLSIVSNSTSEGHADRVDASDQVVASQKTLHERYYWALAGSATQLDWFSSQIEVFLQSGDCKQAVRCALLSNVHHSHPNALSQFEAIASSEFAKQVIGYTDDLKMRVGFLRAPRSRAITEICDAHYKFIEPNSGVSFYAPSSSFLAEFRALEGWADIERSQRQSLKLLLERTPAKDHVALASRIASFFSAHSEQVTLDEVMLGWLRGNRAFWAPFSVRG